MGVILVPKRRTTQPQGAGKLAAWLRSAAVFVGSSPQHVLTTPGGVLTPNSNIGIEASAGPAGRAQSWPVAVGNGLAFDLVPEQLKATKFTLVIVAAPTTAAMMQAFGQKIAGTFVEGIHVGFNHADGPGGVTYESGSINIYTRSASAFTGNMRAAGQIDGKTHSWVLSTAGRIHRDGVKQTLASNTPTQLSTPTASYKTVFGAFYNSGTNYGTQFSDPLYLLAVIPSELPEAVERSLSANPWQIFAPHRSYIPTAAASGLPTLSAAGMTGITTTGGYPTVSYTY